MRQRKRSDINQANIVKELRGLGASVELLSNVGKGVPDLLVGYEGMNILLEVKNVKTSYGKKGLNELQDDWHLKWNGQVATVTTIDEALTTINKILKTYNLKLLQ